MLSNTLAMGAAGSSGCRRGYVGSHSRFRSTLTQRDISCARFRNAGLGASSMAACCPPMRPGRRTSLSRMRGQAATFGSLLALACNQLTGVNDLKVAPEACTTADGHECNTSEVVGSDPLQPPQGSGGNAGMSSAGAGGGVGEGGAGEQGLGTGIFEGTGGLNLGPAIGDGSASAGAGGSGT